MDTDPFDVVVLGNAGIDTNVYLYGADVDFTVESNYSRNIDYVGQAGGYTSRGYAQLGYHTAYVGNVGDDPLGLWVQRSLAGDGVDISGMFIDPIGTNRSVNIMYQDGRRKNFYDGTGNMDAEPDYAQCRAILSNARLAHFHLANWTRRLLPFAREAGVTIACDVQDVVDIDDEYRQDYINQADILFCSAVNYAHPAPLIEAFLARNPEQIIVVGLGAQGCALGTKNGLDMFPSVALPEPVVDTNGAGDGLAVGFLSSYVLDGRPLADSIRRGQVTARYTCTLKANTDELITAELLDALSNDPSALSDE